MHLPIFFCLWHLEYSQEYFILFFVLTPLISNTNSVFTFTIIEYPGSLSLPTVREIQLLELEQRLLTFSDQLNLLPLPGDQRKIGSKLKRARESVFEWAWENLNNQGPANWVYSGPCETNFFASSLMPLRTFTFRISPKSTNNDSIILFLICGKIPLKLFTKRKSPFQCSDVY